MMLHRKKERTNQVKTLLIPAMAAALLVTAGCKTQTRRFVDGETRQTVAGFSEEDIGDADAAQHESGPAGSLPACFLVCHNRYKDRKLFISLCS